jgi:hypothetical protein
MLDDETEANVAENSSSPVAESVKGKLLTFIMRTWGNRSAP